MLGLLRQSVLEGRSLAAAGLLALLLVGGAWPAAACGAMMAPSALDAWGAGGESACGLAGGGASPAPVRSSPLPGQPQPGAHLLLGDEVSMPGMGSPAAAVGGLGGASGAMVAPLWTFDFAPLLACRLVDGWRAPKIRQPACDLLRPPRVSSPRRMGGYLMTTSLISSRTQS